MRHTVTIGLWKSCRWYNADLIHGRDEKWIPAICKPRQQSSKQQNQNVKYLSLTYVTLHSVATTTIKLLLDNRKHLYGHSFMCQHTIDMLIIIATSIITPSNGSISSLLTLCLGNSPVTGEFPSQSPVTSSFDVFFDLRLNKRLRKHSRHRWFETPSRSLWRHCDQQANYGCIGPLKAFLYESYSLHNTFHIAKLVSQKETRLWNMEAQITILYMYY